MTAAMTRAPRRQAIQAAATRTTRNKTTLIMESLREWVGAAGQGKAERGGDGVGDEAGVAGAHGREPVAVGGHVEGEVEQGAVLDAAAVEVACVELAAQGGPVDPVGAVWVAVQHGG